MSAAATESTRLLTDIPWHRGSPETVRPDIVRLLIAVSLVESRGSSYGKYLARVFSDDPPFVQSIESWSREENEHGMALGAWLSRSIPNFDLSSVLDKYNKGVKLAYQESDDNRSIRGSKAGELLSRCAVESATSTYYKALQSSVQDEPLKVICSRLAQDEIKHFSLFRRKLDDLRQKDSISSLKLLYMSILRLFELHDDQMSYAYYIACNTNAPYDRLYYSNIMARIGFSLYRKEHLSQLVRLNLRAFGLSKSGTTYHIFHDRIIWLFTNMLSAYMKIRLMISDLTITARLLFTPLKPGVK